MRAPLALTVIALGLASGPAFAGRRVAALREALSQRGGGATGLLLLTDRFPTV